MSLAKIDQSATNSPYLPDSLGSLFSIGIVAAALGYFVDIYDLVLFSVVRIPSLQAIGFSGQALIDRGAFLMNLQALGLILGGLLWGIWGDRRGRVSVLFVSISFYSFANLANAFANSFGTFAVLRFIAGIGLAGELGAAVTLVAERLPRQRRSQAAALIASFGVCGSMVANLIAERFDWRTTYFVGGAMGFGLLLFRFWSLESLLFQRTVDASVVRRGDFLALFRNRRRMFTYVACILVGVPVWYGFGILIGFAPELARLLQVQGEVTVGKAIMYNSLGFVVGDFSSGFLSQALDSRKRVLIGFLFASIACAVAYFLAHHVSSELFYFLCSMLGMAEGYWALLLLTSAEQFGTNLRVTAVSTISNFIRGSVILMVGCFQLLQPLFGLLGAAAATGALAFAGAFVGWFQIRETAQRDLDFVECDSSVSPKMP